MKTSYPHIGHCRYRISAKAIIKNPEGKIALALKEMMINGVLQTKWDIPGGGIEHGDSVEETLRKEIMEEMGLKVITTSQSPIHFTLAESACGEVPLGLLYYEVEVENFDYTPSDECRDLKFFSIEEALKTDVYPAVRTSLEEVNRLFKEF